LGSASMPAREPPARVRPVGPARGFSARDPASPGVAWSTLVPRHARLEAHGGQARAIRVSAPRHTGRQPQVSTPSVRLAPSESVPRGTRAVSAPRAVGCALVALGLRPTEPSRATSVPASGPRGPQPSESQRARGGHPAPSDAASSTAPRRPPGTDPDPGPRLRHWGLRQWPTRRARGPGRKGAVEAIRDFIPQPPGCRQGTSLAPVAWHDCPAAKRGAPRA